MKKIILYYPKLTGDSESKPLYLGLPLSVLTLAAQLDESKYEIAIIDGRFDIGFDERLLANCISVGISAMTSYQITDGLNFSQKVKELNSNIPVIWGGWHPSLMPEQTIGNSLVDIVITGQGESSFVMINEALEKRKDLRDIPNLIYKDSSGTIISTKKVFIRNINTLRPIEYAYRYVEMDRYIQPLWGNNRVIGYESSRGCPWSCKFCSIGSVYKKKWNALTAEQTFTGVKCLYEKHKIDAVHFYDNNFFVDEKRALEFSDLIIKMELPIKWDGTAVVEQFAGLSDEYIEKLVKGNFFRTIIGIESGDEDVLGKIGKGHSNKQVLQLVERCREHGILVSLSFMVGFPWKPEKDFDDTIRLTEKIRSINPQSEILMFIFSPYLGTPLYNTALEYGMVFPDSLEGWAGYTYEKSNVPWISDKLLRKINRYISMFGTKDMPPGLAGFLNGSLQNRENRGALPNTL